MNSSDIEFEVLEIHTTDWEAKKARVTLNMRCDARIVPSLSSPGGARVDHAHVVVLDNFFDEKQRVELLNLITEKGWDHAQGPPTQKWECATADGAGMARTWGLKHEVLASLPMADSPAMREVHSRLARLYPDVDIAHMPSKAIQGCGGVPHLGSGSVQGLREASSPLGIWPTAGTDEAAQWQDAQQVDCDRFVGNAAVHGDEYSWHVDADPSAFADASPWVSQFGTYCNGEPGKPLLVSLLLYLNDTWPRDWDAETLFLDGDSDIGIVVRPKRYRAVLMDQDVLHRLSAPSRLAESWPRYSLVWKLVFLPKSAGQTCCIARPEWGRPTDIGSAAHLQHVKELLARGADRKRHRLSVDPQDDG